MTEHLSKGASDPLRKIIRESLEIGVINPAREEGRSEKSIPVIQTMDGWTGLENGIMDMITWIG